jgi:hypothetical protein
MKIFRYHFLGMEDEVADSEPINSYAGSFIKINAGLPGVAGVSVTDFFLLLLLDLNSKGKSEQHSDRKRNQVPAA